MSVSVLEIGMCTGLDDHFAADKGTSHTIQATIYDTDDHRDIWDLYIQL